MSLVRRTRLRVFALTGIAALLLPLTVASAGLAGQPQQLDGVTPRAQDIHTRAIVIDTHIDTPQRLLFEKAFDIGARNQRGSIDIPRMREGGLDAVFFSIWMPGTVTGPSAVKRALSLIDSVREAVKRHPKDLMLATTADDIRRAVRERKIAALIGMEGGHMIDEDLVSAASTSCDRFAVPMSS